MGDRLVPALSHSDYRLYFSYMTLWFTCIFTKQDISFSLHRDHSHVLLCIAACRPVGGGVLP